MLMLIPCIHTTPFPYAEQVLTGYQIHTLTRRPASVTSSILRGVDEHGMKYASYGKGGNGRDSQLMRRFT